MSANHLISCLSTLDMPLDSRLETLGETFNSCDDFHLETLGESQESPPMPDGHTEIVASQESIGDSRRDCRLVWWLSPRDWRWEVRAKSGVSTLDLSLYAPVTICTCDYMETLDLSLYTRVAISTIHLWVYTPVTISTRRLLTVACSL